MEHPSCSKQHAVIQFRERAVPAATEGQSKRVVKCVVMRDAGACPLHAVVVADFSSIRAEKRQPYMPSCPPISPPSLSRAAPSHIRPYIMDLESVNKTKLNGEALPPARYVELRPQDTIQFGLSTREYVLMHENMVG